MKTDDEGWDLIKHMYLEFSKVIDSEDTIDIPELQYLLMEGLAEIFEPGTKPLQIAEKGFKQYSQSVILKTLFVRKLVTHNRLEEAQKLIFELEFLEENNLGLNVVRGAYLIKTGKLEEGIADLEMAISQAEDDALSMNALSKSGGLNETDHKADYAFKAGLALLEGKYPKEAIKYFKQAIAISSSQVFASLHLADCYRQLNNEEKAIEIYNETLMKHPYFIYPWAELGDLHYNRKEYDDAIEAYCFALTINDKFAPALFGLGKAYFQKGEYDKATEGLTDFVDTVKGSDQFLLLVHLCESYSCLEDNDNLYKYGKILAEKWPDAPAGWTAVANSLINQLKWDEAVPNFEKVLEFMPDDEDILFYYGMSGYFAKQYEKAITAYEYLLEIDPEHPDKSSIFIQLANAFSSLNDTPKNIKYLVKAYEMGNGDEELSSWIAHQYYAVGDIESVKKYLDLAVNEWKADAPMFFIEAHPEARFDLAEYMNLHYPGFDPNDWDKEEA